MSKAPHHVRTQFTNERMVAETDNARMVMVKNPDSSITVTMGGQTIRLTAGPKQAMVIFLKAPADEITR